jgi:hypothetical protein
MSYQDIVIIGAPRSGTNMLRDVLTRLPGVGSWPCDEINYIWRHHNVRFPSDAFPPGLARPEVLRYIRGRFDSVARAGKLDYVVEKTCANSLRVGFVDRVLSEARYIYIVRDGMDVVASAIKRWKSKLDIAYIARKARYVPVTDLPYYSFAYLGNRMYRFISKEKRLAFWGPCLDDMQSIVSSHDLADVCAIQWRECVDSADRAFEGIPDERVHRLSYESFVLDPEGELERICRFTGIPLPPDRRDAIIGDISTGSVGKGRAELGEQSYRIEPLVHDVLERHGYGG